MKRIFRVVAGLRPARTGQSPVTTQPLYCFLLLAVVLLPTLSHAYAGPGAGFAVLSSFWAIFVAFLYSFYALMTWPIRQSSCLGARLANIFAEG